MVQRIKTGMIADGAVTTAKMNDEVENLFSFRNRIRNGDMRVDQRDTVNSAIVLTGSVPSQRYVTDGFSLKVFGSNYPAGNIIKAQKVNEGPASVGIKTSLKITAQTSITMNASRLGAWVEQPIEADNILDFLINTGMPDMTISFWAKSNKTGNVSVSVETLENDSEAAKGSYCTVQTINAVETWEYKTVTIPATSVYNFKQGNIGGIHVKIGISSNGSWLTSTDDQWNPVSSARGVLSTRQTNFVASTNDYIQITGVQLEKGTVATPFEVKPYGVELALAQRYFIRMTGRATGYVRNPDGLFQCFIMLPNNMRTEQPSGTFNNLGVFSNFQSAVASLPSGFSVGGESKCASRGFLYIDGGLGSYTGHTFIPSWEGFSFDVSSEL